MLIQSGSIEITASPIEIRLSKNMGMPYCRCLEFIGADGNHLKVWIDAIGNDLKNSLKDPIEMLKDAINKAEE